MIFPTIIQICWYIHSTPKNSKSPQTPTFVAFPSFLTKTLQVIFLTLFWRGCQCHLRAATAGDGSRLAVGGHLRRIAEDGFQTTTYAGAWHPGGRVKKEWTFSQTLDKPMFLFSRRQTNMFWISHGWLRQLDASVEVDKFTQKPSPPLQRNEIQPTNPQQPINPPKDPAKVHAKTRPKNPPLKNHHHRLKRFTTETAPFKGSKKSPNNVSTMRWFASKVSCASVSATEETSVKTCRRGFRWKKPNQTKVGYRNVERNLVLKRVGWDDGMKMIHFLWLSWIFTAVFVQYIYLL